MTLARVRTIWTGPQVVGGGVTDLYFNGSSGDEDDMVDVVAAFWGALDGDIATGNTATFEPEVVNINEGTGAIISIVTLGVVPAPVVGQSVADQLPTATQGLMRWGTSGIVNNRIVRGRTFLPAMVESNNDNGQPTTAFGVTADAAALAYIQNGVVLPMIWARPAPGRAGSQHNVLSGSLWSQWAVLRSRRD